MLTFLSETQTVWDKLSTATKPIILYGMGNGADKILDKCKELNIKVSGIFATDEFVRYQNFRGFVVRKYSDIITEFGPDILIVIAFASELPEVLARFAELSCVHETVAPHLPLFEEEDIVSPAWLEKYRGELQEAYSLLADEQSKKVFADTLNYKLSGKINYLFDCQTPRRQDLETLFSWNDRESYLDLGAYNGDTIQEFLQLTDNRAQNIIAVEPDRRNCRKLRQLTSKLSIPCEIHECGIWNRSENLGFSDSGGRQSTFCGASKSTVPTSTIDDIVAGRAVSYIKIDVEGVEKQALEGAATTFAANKPKIFIAAYHYDNDLWQLPLLIKKMLPEYKLYLRKHPYIPCWEINYLATI